MGRRVMARPVSSASFCSSTLPQPHARAVAAAAVGGDQQPRGAGIALAAHALPPAADAFDGEGGGVVIDAELTQPALAAMS